MKNVLLISHYSGTPGGPVDKIYDFLKKEYKVYNIKHPLFPRSDLKSTLEGDKSIEFKINPSFQYFLEGINSYFYWKRTHNNIKKIDLSICFDSLSFTQMYFLKSLFNIKKIIFYNCDYSIKRFSNPLMNLIYRKANLFAYNKCDFFFSLSSRFIQDIDPQNKLAYKNYIVSGFVDMGSINRKGKTNNNLVYAGALDYGSVDFDPLLAALKKLVKNKIKFHLDIYGKENPKSNLRIKIKKLGLLEYITFKGIVENKILIQEILPFYRLGLAPYISKDSKSAPDHAFLGTDLTAKLVDYIAAGLPVVTTEINEGFKNIEKQKFGFLVSNDLQWYEAINKLLTNKKIYAEYKRNALKYAKNYDIDTLLNPIFKRVFKPT